MSNNLASSSSSASLSKTAAPKVTKVERVLFHSNQSKAGPSSQTQVHARLELTPHHFVLDLPAPFDSPLRIPYTLIHALVRLPSLPTHERHVRIYPLGLRLRTFQTYALGFDSEALATDVFETVKAFAVLRTPEQLYAFHRQKPSGPSSNDAHIGWKFYDPKREFIRQGVGSRTKAWRFTDVNLQHVFSPTYPHQLVVPSRISDQTLNYAAKYRSKARIPALTYLHWANFGSITRCSQPLVGLKGNRSVQDEKLVEAIFSSHIFADPTSRAAQAAAAASAAASQSGGVAALGPSAGMVIYGATTTNLIVDARPTTNAMANVAKGAGSENMEHYRGCKKAYLGIDNIHVMRDSLHKLTEALKEAEPPLYFGSASADSSTGAAAAKDLLDRAGTLNGNRLGSSSSSSAANGSLYATYRPGRPSSSHSHPPAPTKQLDTLALKRSNWLKHIAALMEGTMMIVRNVHINSSHVLLHCSDGWDRTSQLAALAQICLDPYFRTLDGLAVLIEKDWLSFGHRFEDRSGHLGHPSRFVTDPAHGDSIVDDWDEDGYEGGANGVAAESEGFEPQAAVNAIWGFTKQLTAGFGGGGGSSGSGNSASPTNLREISPVFHQFIDCLWQLLRQFPDRFEYNAAFLVELFAQVYACEYGTFLLNSERERHALGMDNGKVVSLEATTPSLWDSLLGDEERRKLWLNEKYDPSLDIGMSQSSSAAAAASPSASGLQVEPTLASQRSTASSPVEERSDLDLPTSSTTSLVSDGTSNSAPTKFGDMGVLLANPRDLRFFAELYRRDEREMNALIVTEAAERARYAQRLADAAAGATAAKAAAAAAASQQEAAAASAAGGVVPVPVPIAVEGGSADPGRDPSAAAALAASSSNSTIAHSTSPSPGAIDLGTTLSASRLDGQRLAYQPRVPRNTAATMPRSTSGASFAATHSSTSLASDSASSFSTTAMSSAPGGGGGVGDQLGFDEAGAKMKNLFLGGWGKLQNAIASAGQASNSAPAYPQAPAPGQGNWKQPAQFRAPGGGSSSGANLNPWATPVEHAPGAGSGALQTGAADPLELGFPPSRPTVHSSSRANQTLPAPPPPPDKDRRAHDDDAAATQRSALMESQAQSATLTSNPWAVAPATRSGGGVRLEDVFGAERARSRPGAVGGAVAAGGGWDAPAGGPGRTDRSRSPLPALPAAAGDALGGASYPPPPPAAGASRAPQASVDTDKQGQASGTTSYDPLGVGPL
ncbi:hypothetical protein V8E36_006545 [Tilletia maclaganii]